MFAQNELHEVILARAPVWTHRDSFCIIFSGKRTTLDVVLRMHCQGCVKWCQGANCVQLWRAEPCRVWSAKSGVQSVEYGVKSAQC